MGKPVRLKELADLLNLSRTTVSRALNGYPEVNAETRARVATAAARLGYRPDPVARKLATGRSGIIGVVFPPKANLLVNPHFTEWLAGATGWCAEHGIMLALSGATAESELDSYRRLIDAGQVDGLIVSGPQRDDPRVALLAERGMPFIVHGRTDSERPYAWVDIDNEGAFRGATRLLADLGHTRIALLNGEPGLTFAFHREAGFRAVHRERGLALDERLVKGAAMTEKNGYRLTLDCLAVAPAPTAFLCSSVMTALGCLRALGDRGLKVPDDVSVIAHDDVLPMLPAEGLSPPLTTTRSPIREGGVHAAEMLARIMDGRKPETVHLLMEVDLIVRASTAPPPRRAATA